VIAAGGTAGHVVPALAVADALRADGVEVAFIGGTRSEALQVPAAGFQLHQISVEGLSRTNPARAVRALAGAAGAVRHARALLKQLGPQAVMGAGGYVAGPVALAAVTLRIPVVLTEADSRLGLTNRLLAPFARRVCLAFPRTAGVSARHGERYRVTGRPIFPPVRDRGAARARFSIAPADTCVFVFGGSLGARSINMAAIEAFADGSLVQGSLGGGSLRVVHVCGRRDYAELAERELPSGYDLYEYLELPAFAQALAAADLVVARAGGSVFEIAANGLPAILIAYPHAAGDHQRANARWMSEAGAAITIADDQLTGARLAGKVAALLAERSRMGAMASASLALARPDAARQVAGELLEATRR
jgi:UDP-N-acetylglucosamine--N-acetylmuramyl-(pentapeptide) pyrophosphoryl-undecaprenol N-acetylglucosamine transferase